MTDKVRAKRDGIHKGDTVLVVFPGGTAPRKPRRAKVTEVMRAALRVVFEDDHVDRAVMFKYCTKVEEIEESAPMHRPSVRPPTIAPIINLPMKPLSEPRDEVDVWIEMGFDISTQFTLKIEEREAKAKQLESDSAQCVEDSKLLLEDSKQLLLNAEEERARAKQLRKSLDRVRELSDLTRDLKR